MQSIVILHHCLKSIFICSESLQCVFTIRIKMTENSSFKNVNFALRETLDLLDIPTNKFHKKRLYIWRTVLFCLVLSVYVYCTVCSSRFKVGLVLKINRSFQCLKVCRRRSNFDFYVFRPYRWVAKYPLKERP